MKDNEKHIYKDKLLFPEPMFDSGKLSFSSFLYFNKEKIYLTLHPTVSLFMTGCDPFKFYKIIQDKNPTWFKSFAYVFDVWFRSQELLHNTAKILEPLQNDCFKTIWLSYSRTEEALEENKEIIKSTNLCQEELLNTINIPMASHEFIAHLLFEKFLEFYENQLPKGLKEPKEGISYEESRATNIDYLELYNYCDRILTNNSMEELLINSYFFRIKLIKQFPNILLTNDRLLDFLNKLPAEFDNSKSKLSHYERNDIISWEIFRQITSEYIDTKPPEESVKLISEFKRKRQDEIENLVNKCQKLAEDFQGESNIDKLSSNISKHIKIHVQKEIKDLLKLKKYQYEDLFDEVFSDEKTWMAISTLAISLVAGGPLLTAGAGLAAFANISAKSFKIAAQMDKKVKNSDYALIYRMNK